MKAPKLRMKRVYEEASPDDGLRVLVDRLWPRGVAKAALKLDRWERDLAPSNALRQWYHRDPAQFTEFRERYRAELAANGPALDELRSAIGGRAATLLTAAKELDHSHVAVLRELLAGQRQSMI